MSEVTVAAILAGGKSRRMGSEKAFMKIDGVPLIERVIARVVQVIPAMVIIANDKEKYQRFGYPVHADILPGMGPLSGLHAAFLATGADRLFLVACDMPFIEPALVAYLAGRDDFEDALVPVVHGIEQGLLAFYRRSCLGQVEKEMKEGAIQFDQFRREIKKTLVSEEKLKKHDPALISFVNLNTPADVRRLLMKG